MINVLPEVNFVIESRHFVDKSGLEPIFTSNKGICLPWNTSSIEVQKLSVRLLSFRLRNCNCDDQSSLISILMSTK